METQEREDPRAARSEVPTDQPHFGREQIPALVLSPTQQEKQPEQQPEPPLRENAKGTPTMRGEHTLEQGTCQQWLRWLGEQVSGVADQLDEEQRRREHLMHTMTEEQVKF